MPDDFDLFPDRKNLDPFSFGKEEKAAAGEKAQPAAPSSSAPAGATAERSAERPSPAPIVVPMAPAPSLFDAVEPPAGRDAEAAFDPPVDERDAGSSSGASKEAGKGPSKLVVVGGIVLIVLGLGYAAQVYLMPLFFSSPPPAPVVEAPVVQPAPVAPPVEAAKPVEPAKPALAAKPVEPAKPVVAAKPVEPAKPAAAAKPVVPVAAATGKGFMVQVGGAALKENLDAMVKTVKDAGYDPVLVPGVVRAPSAASSPAEGPAAGGITVVSGPYPSLVAAQSAAGRLQNEGLPAVLTHGTGDEYSIKSGSFPSAAAAAARMAKVKGLGLPVRLDGKGAVAAVAPAGAVPAAKAGEGTRLTLVRVGPFADEAEAAKALDQLATKGFKPILIRP